MPITIHQRKILMKCEREQHQQVGNRSRWCMATSKREVYLIFFLSHPTVRSGARSRTPKIKRPTATDSKSTGKSKRKRGLSNGLTWIVAGRSRRRETSKKRSKNRRGSSRFRLITLQISLTALSLIKLPIQLPLWTVPFDLIDGRDCDPRHY